MSLSGWIVIDKPLDLTSSHVVGIIKKKLSRVLGQKVKIGHTGTLDPFATGILPLALGEATKLSQLFLDADKSYEFVLKWGQQTDTADITGQVIAESETVPTHEEIIKIIPRFLGEIRQTPPKFSALKVGGVRAYEYARQGIDFELKSRLITIKELVLLNHSLHDKMSCFKVTCSKGTYIRTLGEDIAHALNGLGHLSQLRRTKVGFFSDQHTIFPDITEEMVYKAVLDISSPLDDIPAVILDDYQANALKNGQSIQMQLLEVPKGIFLAYTKDKKIIALVCFEDGKLLSKRGFNF